MKALSCSVLAVVLAFIIAFGSLAHAFLPHTHSANEAVTSLLHSALRHEDKKLADLVPPAPVFTAVIVAAILVASFARIIPAYALGTHPPGLAPLRRGIAPYRRFG